MTSSASDFRRIGVAVPVASRCLPLRQEGYELENHETNPSVCTRSCMFAQPVLVITLRLDELPVQPVNGLSFSGVTLDSR